MSRRILILIIAGLVFALNSGWALAQNEPRIEDLQATVEAVQTEIAEMQRDSIPEVDEIDQDEFDELIEGITAEEPTYGPVDGEIQHSEEFIDVKYALGQYQNFLLQVTFEQPFDDDDAKFDFGAELRIHGDYENPTRIYVVVDSDDNWYIAYATDEEWSNSEELELGSGRYRGVETDAGSENVLTLLVDGQVLHLAINGEYVSSVGLPLGGPGALSIGTGFYVDRTERGESTPYTDFAVWEL